MREQEWLQATDPGTMLTFLQGKVSDRKLRLFASACYRHIERLLREQGSRRVVELLDSQAEGLATAEQVIEAAEEVSDDWADRLWWAADSAWHQAFDVARAMVTEAAARAYLAEQARAADADESVSEQVWNAAEPAEKQYQVVVLQDVIGNPFRRVTVDSTWRTWHDGLLVSMAQRMYDSRDFSDMPVLADALEEAGCTNQDILGHCRSGGEHVRGCWVVDCLLGKS